MEVPAIPPEGRALLAGAHSRTATIDHKALGAALGQVTDWDFLLRAAAWHHVAGLLHHTFQPHAAAIPARVQAELHRMHGTISRHNLLLTGEVLRLLQAFAAADVPVVPLKGPALAALCYQRFSLRPAGDIDLLVPRPQFAAADAVLRAAGYRVASCAASADEAMDAQIGREYVHPERKAVAELHGYFLHAMHQFALTPEAVWHRLATTTLDGRTIPCLSPEDALLYLCAHGAKHHYERLKWVGDIAELLWSDAALDWSVVWARADALRSRRLLLLGLHLADRLLGAPVPQPLAHEAATNAAVRRMAQQVVRWLFTEPFHRPESLAAYRFHLQMRERWRDRRAYLAHLATLAVQPTAKDRAFVPLPRALDPLYYAVRPLRLAYDAMTGAA